MSEPKFRSSCDSCLNSKVKCSQTKPSCSRCTQQGNDCIYSQYRKIGRPSKRRSPISISQHRQESKSPKKQSAPDLSLQQQPRQKSLANSNPIEDGSAILPLASLKLDLGNGNLEAFQNDTSPLPWDCYNPPNGDLLLSPQGVHGPLELYADVEWFDGDVPAAGLVQPSSVFDMTPWAAGTSKTTVPESLIGSTDGSHSDWPMESNSFIAGSQASSTCSTNSPSQSHSFPYPSDQSINSIQYPDSLDHPSSSSTMTAQEYSWSTATDNSNRVASIAEKGNVQQRRTDDASKYLMDLSKDYSLCANNCYSKLTEQLNHSNSYLSIQEGVSLESLLDLDEHVGRETKGILRCSLCLSKTHNRHTLMLLTMVMENILCLFERECGFRTFENGEASPLRTSSVHPDGDRTHSSSTKKTLWRKLLRIHLEKHVHTVLNLNELLGPSMGDISYKVSREILVDMYRRLEHLQGFVNSTKGK